MSTLKPTPAHLFNLVSIADGELEAYEATPAEIKKRTLFLILESRVISNVLNRELIEPEKSLIVAPMLKGTDLYIDRRPVNHMAISHMSKKCTVISDDRSFLFDSIYEAIQYIMEKATYWAYWPMDRPCPIFGRTAVCTVDFPYFNTIDSHQYTKLCSNRAIKVTFGRTGFSDEYNVYYPVPDGISYHQAQRTILERSDELKRWIECTKDRGQITFSSDFEELECGKTYDIIEITF